MGGWSLTLAPAARQAQQFSTPEDRHAFVSPPSGILGRPCMPRSRRGNARARRALVRVGACLIAVFATAPRDARAGDTVEGIDGRLYTSDPATIWRWRTAFQHDFAARLDWTVKEPRAANHNPTVVVNGRSGREPLVLEATVGRAVTLDAAGTADPDGDALRFRSFFYAEAGSGIPGQPVLVRRRAPAAEGAGQGSVPPAPAGGPPELPPRVAIEGASTSRAPVLPKVEGIAHVILAVEDGGSPSLTSYRRVILSVNAADAGPAR
jgi:hypothetical protein